MPRRWSRVALTIVGAVAGGAVVRAAGAAAPPFEQAKLTASDAANGDYFGVSAAISGDTAIVGSLLKNSGRGAAYVFTRTGTAWAQQAKLTASDAASTDQFGVSVAVNGDTAIVGAFNKNSAKGAAYVFTRTGTVWTEQAKLTASDAANQDRFGFSVALSGDTAIVGAYGKTGFRGTVYVFTRTGTAWTEQPKLTASDSADSDSFGYSLALSGDTLITGAPAKNSSQGEVYVFTRAGAVWTEQQKLTASDAAQGDQFGFVVAASRDTAVVGAYLKNSAQGAAYAFTRTGTAWTEQQKLTASDAANGDDFGSVVALSGDEALVGAYAKNSGQGAVYSFSRAGTAWTRQEKLTASDGGNGRFFGISVALSGDTAIIGADDGNLIDKGAAYAFTGIPNPGIALAGPATVSAGTPIDVTGAGFGAKPKAWLEVGGSKVALKILATTVPGKRFTAAAASIPRGVNGACRLNVLPSGAATPFQFPGMTIASPVIDKVGPASGAAGDLTTILGSGFGSKKGAVTLDGRSCRVLVWTDRSVEVIVPAKLTPGPADLVVDAGTASVLAAAAFNVK